MDAKQLINLRKQAEKAVAEMPDGEMKVKAFEVILNHLLSGGQKPVAEARAESSPVVKTARHRATSGSTSLSGRILVLQDEGFFKTQKSLVEVRAELKAHGWHYPLSAMSGTMQKLVQNRKLRREQAKHGNKEIWKYSDR